MIYKKSYIHFYSPRDTLDISFIYTKPSSTKYLKWLIEMCEFYKERVRGEENF